MMDTFPTQTSQPETVGHFVKITGTNGTASKTLGPGITVSYVAEGTYDLLWSENPGSFLGLTHGLQAATPADLAGYTAVADTWDSTTRTLRVIVYNSTFAAADLLANQWLCLDVKFKRTAV